ncbi:H(+)/Cl(-) exchange transporter ClcA [Ignatzschineria sp. LJL83]
MKVIEQLIEESKTPIYILLMSALIGILAGLLGTVFQISVAFISSFKVSSIEGYFSEKWQLGIAVFCISALLAMFSYYIVKKFAPEASGSGIPEIEGTLQDLRPTRWRRVIPVKFLSGLGSLGAGMVLGREGPTVQLGANIGAMIGDLFRLKNSDDKHTLLASGAAAGLSVAFNAPLAGIVFVIEEMRSEFKYGLISFKAIMIGSVMATIVFRMISGSHLLLNIGEFQAAELISLWLFLLLGLFIGAFGIIFNNSLLFLQDRFQAFYNNKTYRFVLSGGLIGGSCGLIALYLPDAVGEGFGAITSWSQHHFSIQVLFILLIIRFFTSIISFSSGASGGLFSPLLALGTLSGALFGSIAADFLPSYQLEPGIFAISAMGALFAATVRAPLTGAILVLELTGNFSLVLTMLITCLGSTIAAQALGGRPLYTVLLEKKLAKQKENIPKP